MSLSIRNKTRPGAPSYLPLDWTKIRPRRKRKRNDCPEGEEVETLVYCEDPNCLNDEHQQQLNGNKEAVVESGTGPMSREKSKSCSQMVTLRGKAVFCLHALDCKWFQGHFIPCHDATTTVRKVGNSIALLAVQRTDVNECSHCQDGSYRELDMNLLQSSSPPYLGSTFTASNGENAGERKKMRIDRLVCTGGDMLCIKTPLVSEATKTSQTTIQREEVKFEADKIITGVKVEPLVRRYFSNLVTRMSPSNSKNSANEVKILDVLPDCAVVVGNMSLIVPSEFCG